MATSVQIANWLLGVAVDDLSKKSGEIVYLQDFFVLIHRQGISGPEFEAGLKYAHDQHWVTVAKGSEITITQAGVEHVQRT